MPGTDRHYLREILPPEEASERFERVRAYWAQIDSYIDLLGWIRDQEPEVLERYPDLVTQVAERAAQAAETQRMLLHEGMDAINALFDSGAAEALVSQAIAGGGEITNDEALALLREAESALAEHYPDLRFDRLFEAYRAALEQHNVRLTAADEQIRVQITSPDGEERTLVIEARPRTGHMGRISTADFLSGNREGSYVTTLRPVALSLVDPEHERPVDGEIIDLYAHAIALFAQAREDGYRHAQRMQTMGLSRFEGSDPVSVLVAVFVGAIVIGGLITILCEEDVIENDTVCKIGRVLLVIGTFGCAMGMFFGFSCQDKPSDTTNEPQKLTIQA